MAWVGSDLKAHPVPIRCCGQGCPRPHPTWPWLPLRMGHPQLLWTTESTSVIVKEQGCPTRLKCTLDAWKPDLGQSRCAPRRLQTILSCRVGKRHWHHPTNVWWLIRYAVGSLGCLFWVSFLPRNPVPWALRMVIPGEQKPHAELCSRERCHQWFTCWAQHPVGTMSSLWLSHILYYTLPAFASPTGSALGAKTAPLTCCTTLIFAHSLTFYRLRWRPFVSPGLIQPHKVPSWWR